MADKKTARSKNEDGSLPVELLPLVSATFDDLDPLKVAEYLTILDEGADERSQAESTPQERLAALGLLQTISGNANVLHPTTAALLLFGRQPQKYLPHSSVKLAHFRGNDVDGMIADRKEVFGTLDKVIEDTARFVTNNIRVQARIEGIRREDVPEYPLIAVREALTNALAHRDYGIAGQKVTLRIFDDRLEVESPGGLAGPVTLENLGQKRYSRNPLLARLMYEVGLIEEMGTGIRRMRRAMAEQGNPPPSFVADDSAFVATLPALPMPDPVVPVSGREDGHRATTGTATPAEAEPVFEVNETNRAEYFALLQTGLNERQARGLLYARERGRLTNRDYRAANPDVSDETARLDLVSLVDKGHLLRIGDKKGASYLLR